MSRQPISFIATGDPSAAKTFYADILGLKLIDSSPYALAFQDGPQMLRVQIVPDHTPPPYTVHGWQVPDIHAEIRDLTAKGVHIDIFDQLPQDADGV